MSKKYESMIGDYWIVSSSINHYVSSHVENFEYWDTDFTKFFIDTELATYTYKHPDAAILLDVSELQMKNFLVVHSCLGNHLDGLIGENDYDFWDAKKEQLVVTLTDTSEVTFQTSDLCELMCKTESVEWCFTDLVNSENEIVAE